MKSLYPVNTDTAMHAPLLEHYLVSGAIFAVSTNSTLVLAAARESFLSAGVAPSSVHGQFRLWVDESDCSGPPWPKPYFGGLDHLIFAGFNTSSGLLLDLRRCRGVGVFSLPMARDKVYWASIIFPTVLGILGPSAGIVALHCACVVRKRDGAGLLLAGGSGAGKSTLAVALAKAGFGLLSDDWTYFAICDGYVYAWGVPTPVKLLLDARLHFPELAGRQPAASLSGELAFEVDPQAVFRVSRWFRCEPRWVVFLEREAGSEISLAEMPTREAVERLEQDCAPEWPEAATPRQQVILALSRFPCRSLRYGTSPQEAAQFMAHFLETSNTAR